MSRALRIAVVGQGIAGAAAAIHLRRRGHRIDHFERSIQVDHPGAGLLLHPAAMPQLERLGILDDVLAHGAPVRSLSGPTIAGRRIMDFRYSDDGPNACGIGIQRRTLHELLCAADPGRLETNCSGAVASVDASLGFVSVAGEVRHGPYDLVVAADGASSTVRRCLAGNVARDRDYRSAALVILVHDPDGWCADEVRQYFDGPRHVSVWPVGTSPADPRPLANVSLNVPQALATHWRESGEWLRALGELCPPLHAMLLRDDFRRKLPTIYRYRDVELRRFVAGRVVMIGDAAHSMSPQLGQGALLALEDACILARLLDRHEDSRCALECFDALRRRQARPIQSLSRVLTPFFQSGSRMLAGVRDVAAGSVSRLPIVRRRMRSILVTARE